MTSARLSATKSPLRFMAQGLAEEGRDEKPVIASASEAIQERHREEKWIASSLALLAMTAGTITTAEIVEALTVAANATASAAMAAVRAMVRARRRRYGPRSSSRRGLRRSPRPS